MATLLFLTLAAASWCAEPAALVLRGGRVHTMDAAGAIFSAVAVRGDRIVYVGDDAEAAQRAAGPGAGVVDLAGRAVIPGLIDTHLHLSGMALSDRLPGLSEARSLAEVLSLVSERAARLPRGRWIVTSPAWHESRLAEGRLPTRAELDGAAPHHPVLILRGGHAAVANSLALRAAGIGPPSADPPGGVVVRDPASGRPTGLLLEEASRRARRAAPAPPTGAVHAGLIETAARRLARLGLTGIVDPGGTDAGWRAYGELDRSGRLPVRVDFLYRCADLAQTRRALATAGTPAGPRLRFAGLKFALDGGVEAARLSKPFAVVPGEQPDPTYRGVLSLPPGGRAELVHALETAAQAGVAVHTHAFGDEAVETALSVYAEVDGRHRLSGRRWAVVHLFLPPPGAARRLASLGVWAAVQDLPVLLGRNQRRWWGEERAQAAAPVRSLLDAGVRVAAGTDAPVVPADPWLSIWWLVTRGTLTSGTLGAAEAVTVGEALRLYTSEAAALLGAEQERGTLETGKLADLVVLSRDPFETAPDSLRETRALLTMVGGRVTHREGF